MRVDQRKFQVMPDGAVDAVLAVEAAGWWVRAGVFTGTAPGSHMMGRNFAWWWTRMGDLHGVNVRFGWWPEPCVTLLLHVRRSRLR